MNDRNKNKNQTKEVVPATEKAVTKLTAEESTLLSKWQAKWAENKIPVSCIKLEKWLDYLESANGTGEEKKMLLLASLCELTGAVNPEMAKELLLQYLRVASPGNDLAGCERESSVYFETMRSFQVKDLIEGALLTQILSLQNLGMRNLAVVANRENSPQNIDRNIISATKLLRLQHETLELLGKYKNKFSQSFTVQHINIEDGGKAIIGNPSIEK